MQVPAIRWRQIALGVALFIVPTAGLIAWARASPSTLHDATLEDGPIESLGATAFLIGAVGFAVAASRRACVASARSRCFLALAALVAFVFCGEELSWGQRILGFATPDPLRELNQQGEFNVHNVGRLQWLKYSLLVATVAGVGVLLPSLRSVRPARTLLGRIGVPVAPPRYAGLFLAALFALRHAANWLGIADRNDPQEFGELLFAIGVALFGLHAAWRPRDVFLAPEPAGEPAAAPAAGC